MASSSSNGAIAQPKRSFKQILHSYFYWTYSRGAFHYDVMVTLILIFIFVTPHLWDYGDRPSSVSGPTLPIQVIGNSGHGLIITVQAADVYVAAGAPDPVVKKARTWERKLNGEHPLRPAARAARGARRLPGWRPPRRPGPPTTPSPPRWGY